MNALRSWRTCAAVAFIALVGCRSPSRPAGETAAPQVATPPDQLAETEIAPGVEKAFDLPLPRGSEIDARFGASVTARIPVPVEAVANFVRRHAIAGEQIVGPGGTVFPKVTMKGAAPDHWLRVEIHALGNETRLVVDRVSAEPPKPAGTTQEEIMKKAGLTPDGKLDPKGL